MNLHKLLLANNACYKSGKKMTPKGIMVHSTGANNPNLCRYVGPDDGLLGKNKYNNHWNQDKPDGRQVCIHAFIGKLADGSIATYQTLPWNMVGWHSGSGSKGSAANANNNGYIGFEICEDGLSDKAYFDKVYREAVELCAYLCKAYGINPESPTLICHSEGNRLGIASNHADVMHWFPKHGKSMDTFRSDVKAALDTATKPEAPPAISHEQMYRVRTSWVDTKTQKGAFRVLQNAKDCADKNPGYSVFDATGTKVYGGTADTAYDTYTVVKGDSLWKIAAAKLGNGSRYPEIKALNGLTNDTIHAGQRLKIPKR
jgi:LysM repeat protein